MGSWLNPPAFKHSADRDSSCAQPASSAAIAAAKLARIRQWPDHEAALSDQAILGPDPSILQPIRHDQQKIPAQRPSGSDIAHIWNAGGPVAHACVMAHCPDTAPVKRPTAAPSNQSTGITAEDQGIAVSANDTASHSRECDGNSPAPSAADVSVLPPDPSCHFLDPGPLCISISISITSSECVVLVHLTPPGS